jgi:hypothetical protein
VGARFERYAAEFIGRVDFATYPAVAILAARGALWGWRAGPALRVISVGVVIVAIGLGAHEWIRWVA